jgi:hypothetical protein
VPLVAFISRKSPSPELAFVFARALAEWLRAAGQNMTVEDHWLDGPYEGLSALMADLVRHRLSSRRRAAKRV